jgi:hypothetical protein
MTQPVVPGARMACFDESPEDPTEFSPTAANPPVPPARCADGLEAAEARTASGCGPPIVPEPAGLRFCREADTVIEGFLCDEPVVVSHACRKPQNAVDSYICDEPRLHALQNRIWEATQWVIRTLVTALLRGGKTR